MITFHRHRWAFFLVFMVFLSLVGPTREGMSAHLSLSAWIPYWNRAEGEKEAQVLQDRLQDISYFAAYFNDRKELVFPERFQKPAISADGAYLTILNDVVFPDGTSRLKDTEQLASLLATGKSRKKHAVSILDLAEKHGFSGVEIDYETLWKKGDTRLQEHFLRFLSELETQAARRHLKVRVILEPSAPFGAPFPKNIEYVVMAYNLHGPHNGPGPKADLAFIRRTMKKMDALRGEAALAFSMGGAIWKDGKEGRFLSEQAAAALAEQYGKVPQRDEASAALHFSYEADGHTMTVWYADVTTLEAWSQAALEAGYPHVFLWSLGGSGNLSQLASRTGEGGKE